MIISCENCGSKFNLDEHLLKPTGSKVRCSKCLEVFTADPQAPVEAPEEIIPSEDADVAEETFAEAEAEVAAEPEVEDEDLDAELGLSGETEPTEAVDAEDQKMDFDQAQVTEEAAFVAADEETDTFDSAGIGLDLDEEPEAAAEEETTTAADELDMDLDLGGGFDEVAEEAVEDDEAAPTTMQTGDAIGEADIYIYILKQVQNIKEFL